MEEKYEHAIEEAAIKLARLFGIKKITVKKFVVWFLEGNDTFVSLYTKLSCWI